MKQFAMFSAKAFISKAKYINKQKKFTKKGAED